MDGLAETIPRTRPIAITRGGVSLGSLRLVTRRDADDPRALERLAEWHRAAFGDLAGPLFFSPEEARRWLLDRVLDRPGRRLFWVRDLCGGFVGHLGLIEGRIADRLDTGAAPELFAAACAILSRRRERRRATATDNR